MDRNTARIIGALLAALVFLLAIVATLIRYAHGKPTDYAALVGALASLLFFIVILRSRE